LRYLLELRLEGQHLVERIKLTWTDRACEFWTSLLLLDLQVHKRLFNQGLNLLLLDFLLLVGFVRFLAY
jgi:hypothetical protein